MTLSKDSDTADDFVLTYGQVSPDDPIVNGARWREERDFARKALRYLIDRCEREYRDQEQPPELDFVILAVEEAKKAL